RVMGWERDVEGGRRVSLSWTSSFLGQLNTFTTVRLPHIGHTVGALEYRGAAPPIARALFVVARNVSRTGRTGDGVAAARKRVSSLHGGERLRFLVRGA